jgi:uncharacterized membrane protein
MLLLILSFIAVAYLSRAANLRFDNSEHRFWFTAHVSVVLFVIVLVLL